MQSFFSLARESMQHISTLSRVDGKIDNNLFDFYTARVCVWQIAHTPPRPAQA